MSSHCVLTQGDIVGGYQIGERLGSGRSSRVWAARAGPDCVPVAIKIFRVGESVEDFTNEVTILRQLFAAGRPPYIIGYHGAYAHVSISDHVPRIHPFIIFDKAGDPLNRFVNYCVDQYGRGLPSNVVRSIMREVLTGLAYLHRSGFIHADVKPENVLLSASIEDIISGEASHTNVCIADLGSARISGESTHIHSGTTQFLAPEIIIDEECGAPIDVWAALVMCYELITGDPLFDVYGEHAISYGEYDDEMTDLKGGDAEDTDCNEDTDSDSSGSETDVDWAKVNYRHLLLIAKVIGLPPDNFARRARDYYNYMGQLKYNPELVHISISDLLGVNYDMSPEDRMDIENFLLCGLKYIPEDRATCAELIDHQWIQKIEL